MPTEEKRAVAPADLESSAEPPLILSNGETTSNLSREATESMAPQRTFSSMSRTMLTIAIAWFVLDAALGWAKFFSKQTRLIFLFVVTPIIVFVVAFAISRHTT